LSAIKCSAGSFNAFTGEEYTGFYIKTEARQLPMALEVLDQLVVHPLLSQKEIERERGVIAEEINMREDTPHIKVADRALDLNTMESYPYSEYIGMYEKEINLGHIPHDRIPIALHSLGYSYN